LHRNVLLKEIMKTNFTIKTYLTFWLLLLLSSMAYSKSGSCLEFDGDSIHNQSQKDVVDYMATFNGLDQYAIIPNSSDINLVNKLKKRSISIWFKANDINKANKQVIYEEGDGSAGFNIYIFNGSLYMGAWAEANGWYGTFNSTASISSGSWHHASLVFSSKLSSFISYLDGVQFGSVSSSEELPKHSGDICIGRNGDTKFHDGDDNNINSFFEGSIDELRIWNKIRLLEEIHEEMNRELLSPTTENNLVCNLRFNQSLGLSISDYSQNGNEGLLENSSSVTWESRTSPIPYFSVVDGNWDNPNSWASGQNVPDQSWARLEIKNNIILSNNKECKEININNNASLTIQSNYGLTVSEDLVNNAGASGLKLKASSNGPASLIHTSNDVLAEVESFFDLGAHYFISAPINDAISNIFLRQYMYTWNEPTYAWDNFSSTDVPLTICKGFDLYNVDQQLALYSGALNNGDLSIGGLTETNTGLGDPGFNLVGNPYPSVLDINGIDFPVKVVAASYIIDHNSSSYYVWSQGSGGDIEARYIQPGQGFFVEVTLTNQTLNFTNLARTHDGLGPLDKSENKYLSEELLKISLVKDGFEDRTYIGFRDSATTGFDHYYDVRKLTGSEESPYVFSYSRDFSEMGINAFPRPLNDEVVPIGIIIPEEGVYSLNITQLYSFSDDQEFYLKDRELHKYYDLREDSIIEFTYQNGQAERRFDLLFNKPTGLSEELQEIDLLVYSSDKTIFLLSEDLKADQGVSFYNVLGQKMGEEKFSDLKSGLAVDWPHAYYLMKIHGNDAIYSQKFYLK